MASDFIDTFRQENQEKIWIKLNSKVSNQFQIPEKCELEIDLLKKGTIFKKKVKALFYNNFFLFYKDKNSKRPQALIFYDFNLRVEWLFATSKNKDSINFDKRMGFKLSKVSLKPIEFFLQSNSEDGNKLAHFLCKKINTYGFHEMYKASKKIGKGSFACVYLVQKKTDLQEYAVKAFSKETLFSQERGKESLKNELKIMRMLSHRNIINLYEVCETENSIYMVLELLKGGSLLDRIKEKRILDEKEIVPIILGILRALEHAHEKGIMHRDIKPENILFRTKNYQEEDVCLADFGLSTLVEEKQYLFFRCGTPGYVAPEVINLKDEKGKYSQVCDVFSVGVILHILLLGKPVFTGKNYNDVIHENKICQLDFNDQKYDRLSPDFKSLLMMMLEKDPNTRLGVSEVLKHPVFDPNYTAFSRTSSISKKEIEITCEKQTTADYSNDMKSPDFDKSLNEPARHPEFEISPLEKRLTIEGFFKNNDRANSDIVMREPILNGQIKTIETFQDYLSMNETDFTKKNKLEHLTSIKRTSSFDNASPSLKKEIVEEVKKGEENGKSFALNMIQEEEEEKKER